MFIGRLYDEEDMFKLNQVLKDELNKQPVDMEATVYLWRKTFPYRRLFTRNNPIKDVLSEYPAYSFASLVSFIKVLLSSKRIYFYLSRFSKKCE
jgi:hypothetical protein